MKYLVVTGGVVSGLGKGISISSLGVLLKTHGLKCTSIKIDPYINCDAGTMSPFEHGEVFVLNDGGEVDLDLGNYERFLDITLTRDHNITTGKMYNQVIQAERRGDYLGKTVQVIPHVTDAIQDWIERVSRLPVEAATTASLGSSAAGASGATRPSSASSGDDEEEGPSSRSNEPDICLVEVGGTVGDIESHVFLEALRQFAARVGYNNIMFVHVSLVPVLGSVGEQKTKPTQHSVKELRSVGINPDVIICRSSKPLEAGTKDKLALFCQVPSSNMLTVADVSNIYHVPLMLAAQGAAEIIARRLKLDLPAGAPAAAAALTRWREIAAVVDNMKDEVRIALVGKYNGLQDSYLSVIKSLQHAAIAACKRLVVDWIDAASLEPGTERDDVETYKTSWTTLKSAQGILVPGGFGERGVEGKILAIRYARENKIPFFGICLGMQCAVIESARHTLGLAGAHSAEFNAHAPHKLVIFMPEINAAQMGGTMRLGARPTVLKRKFGAAPPAGADAPPAAPRVRTLASELYGRDVKVIWERHRHRYEVNPDYVPALEASGFHFTGTDDRGVRMEIIELDRSVHPYFFAVQYHPEFQSQPLRPSPPFLGLILAAAGELERNLPLAIAASRREKGLASTDGALDAGMAPPGSPPRSLNSSMLSAAGTPTNDARGSRAAAAAVRGSNAVAQNGEVASASVLGPIERSPLKQARPAPEVDERGGPHPPAVSLLLSKD